MPIVSRFFFLLFHPVLNFIRGKKNDSGKSDFYKLMEKENLGMITFSTMITSEDLAFLKKDDGVESLQIIGKGACGVVYKTEVQGSRVKTIAIKKVLETPKDFAKLTDSCTTVTDQKIKQIRKEIFTVGRIRHRNLVPLLAYIPHPSCHYLVFEFMKNGSLQDILQQVKDGSRELDWRARHKIAVGVAMGLEYLHMDHDPCIVHRDLKPANVLLDDDMKAHIADFGAAIWMPDFHTHVEPSGVVGTLGYIAPEYFEMKEVNEKCDIYSFGVLLAVLVTGKFPSDEFFRSTYEMGLVMWIRNCEDPKQVIDPKLMGYGYEEQMLLVLKIACFCTLDNPKERPSSKDARIMTDQIFRSITNMQVCEFGTRMQEKDETLVMSTFML